MGGAKLSKTKENAISKIASEDDVDFFFLRRRCNSSRVCPQGHKVNADFYVGVLDWLEENSTS